MTSEIKTPVRYTACLSCGAEVPIYSRASVQVVCPFCRSTLVRTDLQWDTIGEMAALADDLTPLHIGLSGKHISTAFTIIGRIQQQYENGIWNEWLLQLDNQRTAWLSEGSGLYYLTVPNTTSEILPEFSTLTLGKTLLLDGKQYSVSNIESASCIATEGEIPFEASPGKSYNFVDLSGENESFATLDYSDDETKLYTGKILNLNDLQLSSVDTKSLKQQASVELRCAGCGNAVTLHNPATLIIACASCGTANNISASGKLVIAFSQAEKKLKPRIVLGTSGVIDGHRYEVIGFMKRSCGSGIWEEYLLYNPSQGIRWLVCSQGHWTFVKTCSQPNLSNYYSKFITHRNRQFKHFSAYSASVDGVLGEFNWKVKRGEKSQCDDYICPPFIVSSEKSNNEIVWSEGHYIPSDEIATAFDIKDTKTYGVGINQPSPSILGYISTYIITMALAVFIGMILSNKHMKIIGVGNIELTPTENTATLTSEPFTLDAAHAIFEVDTSTDVNNNWADFEYELVNQSTGESRRMNREVAYYSGYDSDGSWSEGSRTDQAILNNVPAGNYVLEVSTDRDRSSQQNVHANITAYHAKSSAKNLWLLLLILGIGPVLAGVHKYYFEKRRWDESDYPWE